MEDENTLWYDTMLNQILQSNEHTELAASQQEGSKAETETASNESTA